MITLIIRLLDTEDSKILTIEVDTGFSSVSRIFFLSIYFRLMIMNQRGVHIDEITNSVINFDITALCVRGSTTAAPWCKWIICELLLRTWTSGLLNNQRVNQSTILFPNYTNSNLSFIDLDVFFTMIITTVIRYHSLSRNKVRWNRFFLMNQDAEILWNLTATGASLFVPHQLKAS